MPTFRKKVTFRLCLQCGKPFKYSRVKDVRCLNPECRSRKWNVPTKEQVQEQKQIETEEVQNILDKLKQNILQNLLTNKEKDDIISYD